MISVTITREELTSHDACEPSIGFFEWLVDAQDRDDSVYFREWTTLHSIWLAVVRPNDAAWLRSRGLIPQLSGAYLSRANLSRADLSGADLSRADLSRANLSGANLYVANLYGAYLSRANLYGANLSGANLSRAALSRTNLYGANLSGSNLFGANLSGSNLFGANLYGAFMDATYYPYGAVPAGWNRDAGGYLRRAA